MRLGVIQNHQKIRPLAYAGSANMTWQMGPPVDAYGGGIDCSTSDATSAEHVCHGERRDDPLLTVRGTAARQCRLIVRVCVVLLLLGFGAAFDKAQFSAEVCWLGVNLAIHNKHIVASIPREKLEELKKLIAEMLSQNVVPLKDLRSFTGKAMNIASLIVVWTPFLSLLLGATSQTATAALQNAYGPNSFAYHFCGCELSSVERTARSREVLITMCALESRRKS